MPARIHSAADLRIGPAPRLRPLILVAGPPGLMLRRQVPHEDQQLVGLADDLAGFEQVLTAAQSDASVLELAGKPGIDETRLLPGLAGAASKDGRLVLAGRASLLERDLPYRIFVDAIETTYEHSSQPGKTLRVGVRGPAR